MTTAPPSIRFRASLLSPSPPVGEGGASRSEATGEGSVSAERDPSSGAEPVLGRRGAPIRVRHLLPQGEKGGGARQPGISRFRVRVFDAPRNDGVAVNSFLP